MAEVMKPRGWRWLQNFVAVKEVIVVDANPVEGNEKIVELRDPGSHFPIAAGLVKLDAYSVAMALSDDKKRQHTFTIDKVKLAERLRQLASLVESREIVPQLISFSSTAEIDEFTLTTMTFKFAEKADKS